MNSLTPAWAVTLAVASAATYFTVVVAISPSSFAAEDTFVDGRKSGGGTAAASMQCWSPEQLRSKKGEDAIRRMAPDALRQPPDRTVVSSRPLDVSLQKSIRRVELPAGSRKLIALTFDLCEQPYEVAGYQGTIVDFLRENNIQATFFAGGKWLLSHRERSLQIFADPLFEIANHTWEHRNLRLLTGQELKDEIINAELAYEEVRGELAGTCPIPNTKGNLRQPPERMSLFRFPFGACNTASLRAVGEAGYLSVQWDVSSGDPAPGLNPNAMVRQVVDNVKPGSIVLFHANGRGWSTPAALPSIIGELRKKNYEFVTVTGLLSAPGATPVFADTCYDSKPGDTDRYDALARKLEVAFRQFKQSHSARSPKASSESVGKPPDASPPEPEILPWTTKSTAPKQNGKLAPPAGKP